MNNLEYLRREQAADYLQNRIGAYTADTLAKMACVGGGPKFRLLGRIPLYTVTELEEWISSKLSKPVATTSELTAQL